MVIRRDELPQLSFLIFDSAISSKLSSSQLSVKLLIESREAKLKVTREKFILFPSKKKKNKYKNKGKEILLT